MTQTTIKIAVEAAQQKLNWQPIETPPYNNLGEFYAEVCTKYASNTAFSSFGASFSYRQLQQYADTLAGYLCGELNLIAGDKVMLQLPNIVQYPIAAMACMRVGLVIVNTNPMYSGNEFLHQANDSGAKAIITNTVSAARIDAVIAQTGIEHIVLTDIGDMLPLPKRLLMKFALRYVVGKVKPHTLGAVIPWRKALARGAKYNITASPATFSDIAVLQYTGGTTGIAKGAMLSHGNLLSNVAQFQQLLTTISFEEAAERLVLPLPLYHIYAFTVSLVTLSKGCETILIADPRDRKAMVKTLAAKPFTQFIGLNTLFVALCNTPAFQALDFSSLKATMSGGMALTEDAAAMWQRVTGCDIVEGYGLTETSPMLLANSGQAIQLGTIGVPVPSTEIRIVTAEGLDQVVGESGELLVRGPQVMQGYWQQPEATADVLSEDGWFATGDIAVVQPDGYVKIVDRKKDMIIVSGFNVFPNEVEAALVSHPNIVECAVVGVKDPATGEQVKAFIVANTPELNSDAVRAYAKTVLTAYKVPRYVEFRQELPKSEVGKILRRELRG